MARARPVTEWRRATPEAVALARELGPRLTNPELATELNKAGHRTGTGKPFDRTAACNLRYAYRIGSPDLLADGELTPRAVAERLGIAVGVVHGWLSTGTLPARRSPTGRWCIPFPAEVEAACRARVAASPHQHRDADGLDRQPGELSIAELAARLDGQHRCRLLLGRTRPPAHPPRQERPTLDRAHSRTRGCLPRSHQRPPTSCPHMSKPHTARKGSQYEVTVPVIRDRAYQGVVANALEPEWEARFESRSYGFRPGRGSQDAIQAIYVTARGATCRRVWVLDADLKAAFDRGTTVAWTVCRPLVWPPTRTRSLDLSLRSLSV